MAKSRETQLVVELNNTKQFAREVVDANVALLKQRREIFSMLIEVMPFLRRHEDEPDVHAVVDKLEFFMFTTRRYRDEDPTEYQLHAKNPKYYAYKNRRAADTEGAPPNNETP